MEFTKTKRGLFQRSGLVSLSGRNWKLMFIDGESETYPVQRMCAWAGVSTSGFYHWRSRPLSATAESRAELKAIIHQVFSELA